ncbi:MAG: hypothetical protein M1822_006378 [Bathelium mastoideum]|nr:MAG: hypothetical protein M1822_006378 [Bathelium mastoideum]
MLEEVEASLRPAGKIGEEQCVFAICGLGGMGKTQVALKYAFKGLPEYPAVLWVPADNREKILARYITFAVELGLLESTNEDQNRAKDLVKKWFENSTLPYLVIFDNADSEDNKKLLAEFWPTGKAGSILITSRDKSLLGEFPGHHITQLPAQDALKLLMDLTSQGGRVIGATSWDKEMQAATRLVRLVDRLPLAITQLASFAIEDCCSLSDLEASYQNFSQLIEDPDHADTITSALTQYPHSLSTVLNMNYERLDQDQQGLLNILSFLDPDKIQIDLIMRGVGDPVQRGHGVFQNTRRLVKARGFLLKSSLLYENTSLGVNWMHRLVKTTCQLRMLRTSVSSRQQAYDSAFNLVYKAFPVPPITGRHDKSYWSAQEGCLAHIQTLSASVESSQHDTPIMVESTKFSKLLHDAAWLVVFVILY